MPSSETAGSRPVRKKRLLRYLILAVIATSLVASSTMAKYVSRFDGTAVLSVAAFAGGSDAVDFNVTLEDMYPGCQARRVPFEVRNFDADGGESGVMLDYSVKVETTGNLPLEYKLIGQKESGDSSENSRLAGSLSAELVAEGGRLPVVAIDGRKTHTYALEVSWPGEQTNVDYSYEIDMVTVTVSTVQVNPGEG